METGFRPAIGRSSLRSRWSLALTLAMGLLLSFTLPAQAATDTLDQSQTITTSFQHLDIMAQTFTAGMTGQLDQVSLASDTSYGPVDLTVQIQSVSGGAPSGTVLGSSSFLGSLTCCSLFHDFVFSPAVAITTGTQYAIVVNVNAGLLTWYTSWFFNAYAGGQLFVSCPGCSWFTGSTYGQDFAFQTWVDTNVTVAPTATISGAPASSPEGTAVSLTGSAAPTSAAGYAYSWTVTKNGISFGSGSGAAFSFTPDDEGTFVVTLQVTDGGLPGTTSVTITGANVAPSAKLTAPLFLTVQESLTFSGSFSDPGALDSHTATWNFGDGATSTTSYGPGGSAELSAAHSYSAAGTYTVTLTVVDDDGGVGTATAQVNVQTVSLALSSIAASIQNITSLNAGQRNSLIAKLNAASDAAARGNTTAANNELNAFLNELQALINTGRISSGEAATLGNAVHSVQAALGT